MAAVCLVQDADYEAARIVRTPQGNRLFRREVRKLAVSNWQGDKPLSCLFVELLSCRGMPDRGTRSQNCEAVSKVLHFVFL